MDKKRSVPIFRFQAIKSSTVVVVSTEMDGVSNWREREREREPLSFSGRRERGREGERQLLEDKLQ